MELPDMPRLERGVEMRAGWNPAVGTPKFIFGKKPRGATNTTTNTTTE